MTRLLLDTSAYSAFMRGRQAVVTAVQEADRVYLNPIVLGELRAGFAAGTRSEENATELRSFVGSARVEVLPVDGETSLFCAAIASSLRESGVPIPANDLWIAATAMQHGLCVVTTDGHFGRVKQVIVRWIGTGAEMPVRRGDPPVSRSTSNAPWVGDCKTCRPGTTSDRGRRRYRTGLADLRGLCMPIADEWSCYDHSDRFPPSLVARGSADGTTIVRAPEPWDRICGLNTWPTSDLTTCTGA